MKLRHLIFFLLAAAGPLLAATPPPTLEQLRANQAAELAAAQANYQSAANRPGADVPKLLVAYNADCAAIRQKYVAIDGRLADSPGAAGRSVGQTEQAGNAGGPPDAGANVDLAATTLGAAPKPAAVETPKPPETAGQKPLTKEEVDKWFDGFEAQHRNPLDALAEQPAPNQPVDTLDDNVNRGPELTREELNRQFDDSPEMPTEKPAPRSEGGGSKHDYDDYYDDTYESDRSASERAGENPAAPAGDSEKWQVTSPKKPMTDAEREQFWKEVRETTPPAGDNVSQYMTPEEIAEVQESFKKMNEAPPGRGPDGERPDAPSGGGPDAGNSPPGGGESAKPGDGGTNPGSSGPPEGSTPPETATTEPSAGGSGARRVLSGASEVMGGLAAGGMLGEAGVKQGGQAIDENRELGAGDVGEAIYEGSGAKSMFETGKGISKEEQLAVEKGEQNQATALGRTGLRVGDQMARSLINDPVDKAIKDEEAAAAREGREPNYWNSGYHAGADVGGNLTGIKPIANAIADIDTWEARGNAASQQAELKQYINSNSKQHTTRLDNLNREISDLTMKGDLNDPEVIKKINQKTAEMEAEYDYLNKLDAMAGRTVGHDDPAGVDEARRRFASLPKPGTMKDFAKETVTGRGGALEVPPEPGGQGGSPLDDEDHQRDPGDYNPSDDTTDSSSGPEQLASAGNLFNGWKKKGFSGEAGPTKAGDDGGYQLGPQAVGGDMVGEEERSRQIHGQRVGDHAGRSQSSSGTGAVKDPFAAGAETASQGADAAQGAQGALQGAAGIGETLNNVGQHSGDNHPIPPAPGYAPAPTQLAQIPAAGKPPASGGGPSSTGPPSGSSSGAGPSEPGGGKPPPSGGGSPPSSSGSGQSTSSGTGGGSGWAVYINDDFLGVGDKQYFQPGREKIVQDVGSEDAGYAWLCPQIINNITYVGTGGFDSSRANFQGSNYRVRPDIENRCP